MELSPFVFITLIVFSVLLAMAVLKILRLPTIPAYFLAGIFVGPSGINILQNSEAAHFAGELGIVLLLFTVGLKFNLSALFAIRNYVFILGTAQVVITALAFAIPAWFFVDSILIATLIGFVAAMSSTAIVSQMLLERNEVASPTGRRSIAVLLLQDIAVIPLIIIYSGTGSSDSLLTASLLLIGKTVVLFLFMFAVAPKIMRGGLNWSARYGDKELFVFSVIAAISLSSMLTGVFGLSYVLGAFIAGILIAETLHRYRVEQIIEPFRQLFLGFFFMTLGILIDAESLADNFWLILLLTIILLLVKFPIIYGCARLVKTYHITACRTSFLLSGTGEFGFVLLALAKQSDILSNELFQLLAPVNLLAMITVPLFWKKSEKIMRTWFPDDWQHDAERLKQSLASTQSLNNHIIICGFGRTGQAITGIMNTIGNLNFVAMDEDYVILDSAGNVEQLVYGSGDRSDSLLAAGIKRASVLIVTYSEPVSAVITVQNARRQNSSLYIIAKASTQQQAKALRSAGANQAMVEAHESGFMLTEQALRHTKDENSLLLLPHALTNTRNGSNPLFQGEYVSTTQENIEDAPNLFGCRVGHSTGITLQDLLEDVEVVTWRRDGREMSLKEKNSPLKAGDQLVLLGSRDSLENTVQLLKA